MTEQTDAQEMASLLAMLETVAADPEQAAMMNPYAIAGMAQRAAAALERLEKLEEALWPFAREADEWDNFEGDEDLCPEIGAPDESTDEARFTVGDLRRARSLITPAPEG